MKADYFLINTYSWIIIEHLGYLFYTSREYGEFYFFKTSYIRDIIKKLDLLDYFSSLQKKDD